MKIMHTGGHSGDDCDTQIYDCDDYSYEIMNAAPPVPAKPRPDKPHDHDDGHGGHGDGHGGGIGGGHENTKCEHPWIHLATGCYRF